MIRLFMGIILCVLFLPKAVHAYGTGYRSYPLLPMAKLVGAEFTGIFSEGGGVGIQSRYTQKISAATVIDFGVGMNGGERSGSVFAGIDYEIFPDYGRQPKISFRAAFENTKEFGSRYNIISLAPTISKGFSFWGVEAYPFWGLPLGISLSTQNKTYQSQISTNFGLTGDLPLGGYKQFVGTIEAFVDIKDSFSGIFFGISYPLN